MSQKSLRAIYCDDIRTELGGKLSFMGVYSGEMLFPAVPASLLKLCAHVTLTVPFGDAPKSRVHIRLVKSNDEVLGEATLDEAALSSAKIPSSVDDVAPEDRTLALSIGFVFAPFLVPEPTKVSLLGTVDGEELKGNSLRIRVATDEERKSLGLV